MADLPILIPASQKKADGYSLMPLQLFAEERLWPAEEEDGYLEIEGSERHWTPAWPLRIEQAFLVDGHDVRTEERDPKTGEWRQRVDGPMVKRTEQVKNESKRASRRPGLPLRQVTPRDYSRPALSKCLGELKTDLLTALNSLLTALKKGKTVDIKEAEIQFISAEYAASVPERRNELAKQLQVDPRALSPIASQELASRLRETEGRLSDRLSIEKWVEQLSDSNAQILATGYIGRILFHGRVIFWTTATKAPQISSGIFFPDLAAAVAAAVVLDGELRRCLNPKCGRIFSASRYDGVCCNLRCSNAFRQFRHSSKSRRIT